MKKLFLAIVAVLGFATAASAQTDITVSYGGYTQMDAMDCHDGGTDVNTAWGALNVGVNFNVAPKLYIGPSYTFSSTSRKHIDDNKFFYHGILLNGRYEYYRNSIVSVSGHAGVGTVIMHQTFNDISKNKAYFAFQVSPVHAYVNLTPRCGIFGEAGFGSQGIIQIGFRANL